jgi:cobalt-precorrin-5B (C1)-methyltransferase
MSFNVAFVEYGNYIGETLKIAHELNIKQVTLGVMLGKAVKLAQGHLTSLSMLLEVHCLSP